MSTAPRLFSHDEATGITKWFHWDDSTDDFLIQTVQKTDEILDTNKEDFNNAPDRWGDGQRVASLPLSIWTRLQKAGIMDDPKALRRWLNDPDNRAFRTRPGRL